MSITLQDIFTHGTNRVGGKDLVVDSLLPFILLPGLLLISTISLTVTIIVMVVIGMSILYVYSRPRQKNRSPFFFSWTLSTAATLFTIFNASILGSLEVTFLEQCIFFFLSICCCFFFFKMKTVAQNELSLGSSKGKEYSIWFIEDFVWDSLGKTTPLEELLFIFMLITLIIGPHLKLRLMQLKVLIILVFEIVLWTPSPVIPVITSDSKYCHICQIEVNRRFFHTIWWDCCVFRPNYLFYLCGQMFAFTVFLIGTNLGLTTLCEPYILYGPILMPGDCSMVYNNGLATALAFVGCIYGLGYLCAIGVILLQQFFVFIPKYFEPSWRRINVLSA